MKRESRRTCRSGLDCKQPQCRFLHPKWNCSVCTYLNAWEEPDCIMCAHPRVKSSLHIHVRNLTSAHSAQPSSHQHAQNHHPPQPPYYHPHAPEPDLHGDWNKKKPPGCEGGLPPCPNGQQCTIRTSTHTNMFSHLLVIDHDSKLRNYRKKGGKPSVAPLRSADAPSDILMDVSSLETSRSVDSPTPEESLLARQPSIPDAIRVCSEETMDPIMLGRSSSSTSFPSPIMISPPRSLTEPTRNASDPPESPRKLPSPLDSDDSLKHFAKGSKGITTQKRPLFVKSLSLPAPRQTIGTPSEEPEVVQERLWQAVESGDCDAVGLFLHISEHFIKCVDAQGNTPLIRAAILGHVHLVSYLLEHGASVNESNKDGFTPLLAAALNGQEATVQLLLDHGTDVEQRCKASYTALHCACFRGHLATVKLLVERGANMEHIAKGGMTPLLFSGFAKHAYTVQYLVSQGADVKVCDASGRSLLDFAASNSDIKFALDTGMQLWQHRRDEDHRKKVEEAKKKQRSPKDTTPIQSAKKVEKAPVKPEVKSLSMDIYSWTETEVRQWLDEQNFSNYATSFCENMINGEMLLSLTESELEQDLKIENRLHRRRLLLEIGKLAVKAQANQNLGKLRGEPEETPPPASPGNDRQSQPRRAAELPWQQKPTTQEYGARLLASPQPAGIAVFQASDFSDVHLLAKGEFSVAFAAVLTTTNEEGEVCQEKVVIKLPNAKPGPNEWNELNTFLHVAKHPNILPFLGICKDFQYNERKSSFCIITKRQAGSIKDVLINSKHSEFDLPVNKLRVIHDFASGLAHLHAHNVIHRDVASRNILISYSGTAVVCDFGLSRSIDPQPDEDMMDAVNFKETYYRVDQQHLLPVRWMAPESLNSGKFSRKSDVWMFGVTVWQVLTSCDQKPYESLATANQVIITVCTGQGGPLLLESLTHLPACLHALRDLVSQCLQVRPSDRPTMAQCCHLIKSLQDSISNNANNLPASLSDLRSKGTKPKPVVKTVEHPVSTSVAVPARKVEKLSLKSNGASLPPLIAQTPPSQQIGRKQPEKGIPVLPKTEKSGVESSKPKNLVGGTSNARGKAPSHVNKPTLVHANPNNKSSFTPKKVTDYDEVLVPFNSEDEEPG